MNQPTLVKNLTVAESSGFIAAKLDQVIVLLKEEINFKQQTIARQEAEIQKLRIIIDDKNRQLSTSQSRLEECQKHAEGNRQLINKLLNDMRQVQNDVDWYKRTYEKRSFIGVLKERLKRPL